MQMLILLFVAFAVGCLLVVTVTAINKYWCSSRRRRVFRPIPERRSNRSDHCHKMISKGMVFRYMWVYSKEDTMARTCRPMVTS